MVVVVHECLDDIPMIFFWIFFTPSAALSIFELSPNIYVTLLEIFGRGRSAEKAHLPGTCWGNIRGPANLVAT